MGSPEPGVIPGQQIRYAPVDHWQQQHGARNGCSSPGSGYYRSTFTPKPPNPRTGAMEHISE
eukprot:12923397-Prorocentrum_lima.AAC.1